MSGPELGLLLSQVVGGLALFLFGLQLMTGGLRAVAGARLRGVLARATRRAGSGVVFGTVFGLLAHSSATASMLVVFVHAGLISVAGALPPVLGANVGTTLSMQILSLDVDDFCYAAIALGFLGTLVPGPSGLRACGRALFGFGLIFLGMQTMSGAIQPHRELFVPWLRAVDGASVSGMATGIGISAAVTGIIQSSGATIGMSYALVSAGVFTELSQVYPIILGAHIGTCVTPLLASIGTGRAALRVAVFHLLFNVGNVLLGWVCTPWVLRFVPLLEADMTRQIANTHTLVMAAAALLVLPFTTLSAHVLRRLVPDRGAEEERTCLDEELLAKPESALLALIGEVRRTCSIAERSLRLNLTLLYQFRPEVNRRLIKNEQSVNEIKRAAGQYTARIAQRYLSRRQTILLQHLDRCVADTERIGDHVDAFRKITVARRARPAARFDAETLETLVDLHRRADEVLAEAVRSLDPDIRDHRSVARTVLDAGERYVEANVHAKSLIAGKIAEHQGTPSAALYFAQYMSELDRIVRHAKRIALAESHPDFWIKRSKLQRRVSSDTEPEPPAEVDEEECLDRLHKEGYL